MRRTNALPVLFLVLLGLAGRAAADAGKSSANFLKMGVGGRGVAMGDAQTAATEDVMSVYWNPAGLAELYQNEIGFMHNSSVQGVSQDVVYYALPTHSANVWAVGLSHLNISGISGRDSFDGLTGDIPASDTLISLSWARPWDDLPWFGGLQTGINVKVLRKILDQDSGLGYMGDFGILYEAKGATFEGLRSGLVFQNFGTGIKFDGQSTPFPSAIKTGLAYPLFGKNMTLALDAVLPTDGDLFFNLGGEYKLWDILGFRLGFKGDQDTDSGLTYGLQFGTERLHLDYAFVPMGNFGDSHRVSLNFRFGRAFRQMKVANQVDKAFDRAKAKYADGYLVDAYMLTTDILSVAPWHQPAKMLAKRIEYDFKAMETEARQQQLQAQVDEHFARGEQLFQIDSMLDSRREFEAILALQPDHMGAKTYLNRIDERFRSVSENFYTLAAQAFSSGNFILAKENLERVVSVDPNHEEARQMLSRVEDALRKEFEAADRLAREQRIKPLMEAGQALMNERRYEEALAKFNEVLAIDTGENDARRLQGLTKDLIAKDAYNAGMNAAREGDYSRAEAQARKALKYRPEYTEAQTLLDQVREEAKKVNTGNSQRLYRDALESFLSGDRAKALELTTKALEFDSENQEARRMYERLTGNPWAGRQP